MKTLLAWVGLVMAGSILPTMALAAEPAAEAFDLSRVRLLDGPFRQIQELHRTGLVGQLEPDKLLFPFRKNARLPQPAGVTGGYGGWDEGFVAGHYAGHYLSAAARMYAATGDVSFRDKANSLVKSLAECQEKLGGGYLSAFAAARFDKLEANPRKGLVEYYTIHKILAGLVDVADLCGNRQAFEVAAKLSDCFAGRLAKLTPEQIEVLFRTDYAGNPVNEFGGMAEALTDLYELARRHGDANAGRHLRLAAFFKRDWLIGPLIQGEDKLAGLHGNTHVAQASGIARYALASGDDRAGQAAEAFWKLIVHDHSFVIGGNGFDEKLRGARIEVAGTGSAALSSATAETCNTHNMLKLSRHLFQRDPLPAYADYMELALYNHILASISPKHGRVTYFTPLRPGDFRTYLDGPYCCQGTGIENAARFGEAIYFHHAATLWVNLFIASTLDWREQGMKLRLETRYPETGTIRLTIQAEKPVQATLNLRIPGWVDGPVTATINGQRQPEAKPGSYLALERVWNDGDAIELSLPLLLRVRPSLDDPQTVSLFHGPLVLAGELGCDGMPGNDVAGKDAFTHIPAWPVPVFVKPNPEQPGLPIEPVAGLPPAFHARMINPADQKAILVRLAPLYRVQHQRFAVYWKVLTPEQVKAIGRPPAKAATPAGSFVGNAEEEKARNFQGERSTTGRHQGRRWRDAAAGGWFSYRLPVDANTDVNLVCTYWGGETGNRVFDIVVEDKTMATQTLNKNQPGQFFDVAYRIPAEQIRGKQFVTVRFQAHAGAQAGGLFDCRLVPVPAAASSK